MSRESRLYAHRSGKKNQQPVTSTWRSCCCQADKHCLLFFVQTFIGVALLLFCGVRLTVEHDCDKAAPYWGLIGTICGFFFRKISTGGAGPMKKDTQQRSPESSADGLRV